MKIPEIRRAVDRGDRSVIPQLVRDLEDADPAVRFYAIGALRRLTGEDFGYDWRDDDRHERHEAVERWRAYLEASPTTSPS